MFSKTLSLPLSTFKDLTTYLYLRIIISKFHKWIKGQDNLQNTTININ